MKLRLAVYAVLLVSVMSARAAAPDAGPSSSLRELMDAKISVFDLYLDDVRTAAPRAASALTGIRVAAAKGRVVIRAGIPAGRRVTASTMESDVRRLRGWQEQEGVS